MKQALSYILTLFALTAVAQKSDPLLPQANKKFADKNYRDAEANYRISQSKNPDDAKSIYNLGNTIYTINQPAEAGQAYIKAAEKAKTRPQKHKAFHNLGNVFMKDKNYTAAVKAYREALINDPADDETRYNYALAKKFLKDNPPPPKDKDEKDKQAKKEQDEKSDAQKQNEDKGGKDGDKPDESQDKGKDDKQSEQPKSESREGQGIPKQRIENLLDAVNNEEKKVQDKIKAQQVKGKPVPTDKDW